jgi:hypothetical protein
MRASLLEQTVTDSTHTRIAKPARLYVGFLEHYYTVHVVDGDQRLRYLRSEARADSLSATIRSVQEDPWTRDGLSQSSVTSSEHATLVPAPFYHEDLSRAYAQLNFGALDDQVVLSNYLPQAKAYLVFTLSQACYKQYQQAGLQQHYHIATPWLAGILTQFQSAAKPVLCFDVEDPLLRVAVVDQGSLAFFNTFSIAGSADLLYYLIKVARSCGLNPHKDAFYGSGLIFQGTERFQQLYRYIRYLYFLDQESAHTRTDHLEAVPEHLFYNILGLPLCAS